MLQDTVESIKAYATAQFPKEACGLVAIVKGRERFMPCENMAESAQEHFVISGEDYARVEDQGEIIAVFHSHPNVSSRPSEVDLVNCEESGLPWYIVSVIPSGEASELIVSEIHTINPSGYESPLVGRPFAHGTLDCWALCRDWLKRERSIDVPNPPRQDAWWEDGKTELYSLKAFREAGFVQVHGMSEAMPGDLIVMQVRSKVPNHAAIYLGDGIILHHVYHRLSSRDVYGGYWHDVTRYIVRHKDLV